MQASVIIPCLNESAYIANLLSDLVAQKDANFEVIVVDSQSTDDTAKVVDKFKGKLSLRLIQAPRGVAKARNAGAAAALAPWLIFVDADVRLPDEFFIQRVVSESSQKKLLTSGVLCRIKDASLTEQFGLVVALTYQRLWERTHHPVACYVIGTLASRFKEVGGFDETLPVGEDYDYVSRSAGPGRRFRFVKSTYIYMSLRRYNQKGRIKFFLIAAGYEVYRLTHGYKIDRDWFHYDFGHHKEKP